MLPDMHLTVNQKLMALSFVAAGIILTIVCAFSHQALLAALYLFLVFVMLTFFANSFKEEKKNVEQKEPIKTQGPCDNTECKTCSGPR